MKKFTAILFVLVLILSLSAPALAASGETKISVNVDSSNISVSVPLELSITAKVDGGAATVPSEYKITNNSRISLKVDTIAVALRNTTDWAFKGTAIDAGTDPASSGVNDIYLSVNGQVLQAQAAAAPATPANWNIPAHNGTTPGELNLPLVCSTSRLDQTTEEADLITITYVISVG